MPPLSWGSDKENFYCLKEGVTTMQLLVDHSELTHQMLENLYLIINLLNLDFRFQMNGK